jgi:hypothetical protein
MLTTRAAYTQVCLLLLTRIERACSEARHINTAYKQPLAHTGMLTYADER